ncbi:MAG: glycosyltransferase family 4 protein [Pyramidobacter sp.]|jgi:UDP-GlcNAc:undecaprenyl-phosphate GlcNAc-1-phosphate transferase
MRSLWICLVFLIWGAGITPIAILLSQRYGMLDYPNERKIHTSPVPRGAGIVLWSGFMLWTLLFAKVTFELRIIATGATLVFFAGYIDDMLSLSPYGRLCVHFFAAALSLLALGHQSIVFTVVYLFWVAGMTNAYNFIDGMNGLALSMAFVSLGFFALVGKVECVLPMISMILGVFFWNFPSAKTFLGDGGVYLLGYFTACLALFELVPMNIGLFKSVAALLFIGGVPVIDTLSAIVRRLVAGKSPFYPDRKHIHHRLLAKGLTPPEVLAILCALQMLSLGCAWLVLF